MQEHIQSSELGPVYAFLSRISDWFVHRTGADGSVRCARHHIEHTGKNTYTIAIDLALYEHTHNEMYFDRAVRRARRTASQLWQEPNGNWTYLPGLQLGHNMSNNAIDSGACTDTLATLVAQYGAKLSPEDNTRFKETIEKNASTYLVSASVGKPIINQRLWASTGLASASALLQRSDWRDVVLASAKRSVGDMWNDGVFPYETTKDTTPTFEGHYETTAFYHSRHAGFMHYALSQLNACTPDMREMLIKSAYALLAFYRADGTKVIALEGKRWYFLSPYEVGGNTYDIYLFMIAHQITGDPQFADYAVRAFRAVEAHEKDGEIRDHDGVVHNFQCEVFWGAHTVWIARVARELEALLQKPPKVQEVWTHHLPEAELVAVHTPAYTALVRGGKKKTSVTWGTHAGAGLLSFMPAGSTPGRGSDACSFAEWGTRDPGQWYFTELHPPSRIAYVRAHLRDYMDLTYYVWGEVKQLNPSTCLFRGWDLVRKLWHADRMVASHLATNASLVWDEKHKTAIVTLAPSSRMGRKLAGVTLTRTYRFVDNGIEVAEKIILKHAPCKRIVFYTSPRMQDMQVRADVPHTSYHNTLTFPRDVKEITVSYQYHV